MAINKSTNSIKVVFRMLPVVGVLCLLGGFFWAVRQARFDPTSYTLCGVGIALFLTLFVKAEVANLKYYLHVFVYSVLVLGICVIGYLFVKQYAQKVDLTKEKLFSLSDQTTKYLRQLKKKVSIIIFTDNPAPFKDIENLYNGETKELGWQYHNAIKEPMAARMVATEGTVRNGDIFIKSGENSKRLNIAELAGNYENVLTNAIIEVTRDRKLKICFLGGHGEIAYEAPEPPSERNQRPKASLSAFREFLTERGFETAPLDLAQTGFVPKDAAMIVVAGPQSDLFDSETKQLEAYLKANGKMLVMFGPPAARTVPPMPNIKKLLADFGVDAPDELVLDLFSKQLMLEPYQPMIYTYDETSPITRDLSARGQRYPLSFTRPLRQGEVPSEYEFKALVKSSPQSMSVALQAVYNNEPVKPMNEGPQILGASVSSLPPPQMPAGMPSPPQKDMMRLVVYGSNDLIENGFLGTHQMAVELMLDTVNWLTQQEDMIAVPPRQLEGTPIILTGAQLRLIFVFTVVAIPALLFFGGISYSLLRRRT
ncbi:MAG: GldG family protein [bacterium]|nr:GldG family protein [bacterium]